MLVAEKSSYPLQISLDRITQRVEQVTLFTAILLSWAVLAQSSMASAGIPRLDDSKYAEAQGLLAKKKWSEAAVVLRSVLRDNREFTPAALDLAAALTHTGRREEALSILNDAAAHERGRKRDQIVRRARVISRLFLTNANFQIYQEGLSFMSARKFKLARERFERAALLEPDNVEILTRIGQCLALEGDFDSAAERFRAATRLNSHEPEIHLWLGHALHQRGELNAALDELKAVQVELVGSEIAPLWLAEAYLTAGQRNAALLVLESDLRTQPFHLESLVMQAQIYYDMDTKATLWSARQQLQVALSRVQQYSSASVSRREGEMGYDVRVPAEAKEKIQVLLDKIDSKLEGRERS